MAPPGVRRIRMVDGNKPFVNEIETSAPSLLYSFSLLTWTITFYEPTTTTLSSSNNNELPLYLHLTVCPGPPPFFYVFFAADLDNYFLRTNNNNIERGHER